MARDPRYDPLFEPIKIGPVTAPNRFYQVPHCSGMGYARPRMMAAMRGVKAEGGWGVVCTEYCSIDAGSDDSPYPSASLRDEDDVKNLRLMTDAVHAHGALAGVELWYGGRTTPNMLSREPTMDVASLPYLTAQCLPGQSRAMTRADIVEFREMHKRAARRAIDAGFDIVYVYGNHHYLLQNFLNPHYNQRSDEYGGSADNRVRLLRELIEDVGEVVAGRAALAVRYSAPLIEQGDPIDLVECFGKIAELPDLWDLTVDSYRREMGSSRFVKEASLGPSIMQLRALTSKPVVAVGRFTSPDTMLAQLTSGTQDFIGAARPSIADPFLPQKIDQGRGEDIRECIGCNVCYAHNSLAVPIRCTQNPSMGEEWRRGWHPEKIDQRHSDASVLVVGAGPAGLEAARALGQRGYDVILAEAEREPGGRINLESRLPGLAEYARVRDWRLGQIARMPNVTIYPDNRLDADAVVELDTDYVLLATGARWRSDGVGTSSNAAFSGCEHENVISMNKIMRGTVPAGSVAIYDDEHYYLGGVVALMLAAQGCKVTLISPESTVGRFNHFSEEHDASMAALIEAGVEIATARELLAFEPGALKLGCVYSGRESRVEADYLIPVGARIPNDELWFELESRIERTSRRGGPGIQRIGDCLAPGIIAAAVHSGHGAARALGGELKSAARERVVA